MRGGVHSTGGAPRLEEQAHHHYQRLAETVCRALVRPFCLLLACFFFRFGLTQLHQLRGRVGRDRRRQSFCFLLVDRLNKVRTVADGAALAESSVELKARPLY